MAWRPRRIRSPARWWYLGPLCLTIVTLQLVHSDATYLGPLGPSGGERAAGRLVGLGVAYVWAARLCAAHRAVAVPILACVPFYWAAVAFAVASIAWSQYPLQVITDVVHATGIALVCAAATIGHRDSALRLLRGLAGFLGVFLATNLLFVAVMPHHGIHANGRWEGLLYAPNHLGMMALITMWAGSICFHSAARVMDRALPITAMSLAMVCLYGSNSVTSIVLSAGVIGGTPILLGLACRERVAGVMLVFFLGYIAAAVALALYFFAPEVYSLPFILEQFGRDSSFTGRTEIWALARDAVQQRPYVGWSYDSLRTLHAGQFSSLPAQMHNGYIHLLVLGGGVGAAIVGLFVLHVTLRLVAAPSREYFSVGAIGLAMCLLHNFTEASLYRPGHVMWLVLLLIAFLLGSARQSRRMAAVSESRRRRAAESSQSLAPQPGGSFSRIRFTT